MRVIVIGCGPAGLAAAHAAAGLDCEVTILAPKVKTPQHGPLLIQRPIPGINTGHPDGTIHQFVIGGSILEYRYKLYGDINIGINGDILQRRYHAWNHTVTYDRLWSIYHNKIQSRLIEPSELCEMHTEADLVVSTANAKQMCWQPFRHEFQSAEVYVTQESRYPGQPNDTIVFNAGDDYAWVRSSRIFGNEVTEWLMDEAAPGARRIVKPINTDCDCYPRVLRTGRFGAWRNEVWVDTAYYDTRNALISMQRKGEFEEIG